MSKRIKLSDLSPDLKNHNRHTPSGMALLEKSVEQVGVIESITVSSDDAIISGNARHEVIGRKYDTEPIIVETDGTRPVILKRTDIQSNTPEFYRASIFANTTAKRNIDIDLEVVEGLAVEYDLDIQDMGVDMEGFTAAPEAEEDDYEIPDTIKTDIVLGDLFEIGQHRLLCGDSTDSDAVARLMDGKLSDLVFTDPPYGVEFQSGMSNGGTATRFDVLENDDTMLDIAPVIWLFMKEDTAAFIWTSHHVYPHWRQQFEDFYKQTIIWYKGGGGIGDLAGSYALDYEMALFCVKGRPLLRGHRGAAVWDIGKDAANDYLHPTQKPIALAARAIEDFSDVGSVVMDLFAGSGSTIAAGHQMKRTVYAMEKSPKFCQVIVDRMIKLDPTLVIKRNGLPYEHQAK